MDRMKAEGILTEILKPINEGAENPDKGQDYLDVRKVLRGRLPSGVSPEVEGVSGHGLRRIGWKCIWFGLSERN